MKTAFPLLCALAAGVWTPALAQDQQVARALAATCSSCHGTEGHSVGGVPPLAGRDRNDLIRQMNDFKAGKRPATIMHQIARGYSDGEIVVLADYFSGIKPVPPPHDGY